MICGAPWETPRGYFLCVVFFLQSVSELEESLPFAFPSFCFASSWLSCCYLLGEHLSSSALILTQASPGRELLVSSTSLGYVNPNCPYWFQCSFAFKRNNVELPYVRDTVWLVSCIGKASDQDSVSTNTQNQMTQTWTQRQKHQDGTSLMYSILCSVWIWAAFKDICWFLHLYSAQNSSQYNIVEHMETLGRENDKKITLCCSLWSWHSEMQIQ